MHDPILTTLSNKEKDITNKFANAAPSFSFTFLFFFFFPQLPALFPPGKGYFASPARCFVYPHYFSVFVWSFLNLSAIATGKPRYKLHNFELLTIS